MITHVRLLIPLQHRREISGERRECNVDMHILISNSNRTHMQNLAEVYETEIGDIPQALESYELAASWYVQMFAFYSTEKYANTDFARFESDNAEAVCGPLYFPHFGH